MNSASYNELRVTKKKEEVCSGPNMFARRAGRTHYAARNEVMNAKTSDSRTTHLGCDLSRQATIGEKIGRIATYEARFANLGFSVQSSNGQNLRTEDVLDHLIAIGEGVEKLLRHPERVHHIRRAGG